MNNKKHVEQTSCDVHNPLPGTQPSTGTDNTSEISKAGMNQIQLFTDHFAWYQTLKNTRIF